MHANKGQPNATFQVIRQVDINRTGVAMSDSEQGCLTFGVPDRSRQGWPAESAMKWSIVGLT